MVSALPFAGVALGHAVESWELGVGALGILLAGWTLIDELLDAPRGRARREVRS